MKIQCVCDSCDAKFRVSQKHAGKSTKCPRCEAAYQIPAATQENLVPEDGSSIASFVDSKAAAPSPKPAKPKPKLQGKSLPDKPPAKPKPAPLRQAKAISDDATDHEPVVFPMEEGAAPLISVDTEPTTPSVATGLPIQSDAPKSSVIGDRHRPKSKLNPLIFVAVGGVGFAGVAACVIAFAAYMWLSSPGTDSEITPSDSLATLVLDWPPDLRDGARVEINGQRQALPLHSAMTFELQPGDHDIVIQRRGYKPIQLAMSLEPGRERTYKPNWDEASLAFDMEKFQQGGGASFDFKIWHRDFEEAQRKAAASGKDILTAFISTDDEDDSKHFTDNISGAPGFVAPVGREFELVVVNVHPQELIGDMLGDQVKLLLIEKFGVEFYPAVALADSKGLPYALDYYEATTPDYYAQSINRLQSVKAERDQLLDLALQGNDIRTLRSAEQALEWIDEHDFQLAYHDYIQRWFGIAKRIDPDNSQGRLEVFFEADWRGQIGGLEKEPTGVQLFIRQLDTFQNAKQFKSQDRGARLNMMAALLLAAVNADDLAGNYVNKALTFKPEDRELAEEIQAIAKAYQRRDQLSSGSGFVIAAGGYILTNHHVIEGPGNLVVRLPGTNKTVPARVLAKNAARDIALVKIDSDELQPMPISPRDVGRGSQVAVFGFPLGDAVGAGLKLTTGVVGGLPNSTNDNMLLLDCRVNPGNSGGPLCNTRGEVVGMVTAKSRGGDDVDSYGMALPAQDLADFLREHLQTAPPFELPEKSEPAAWDKVDRQVSGSVVMLLKMR